MLSTALHMAFVRSHHGRLDDLRDALMLNAAEEQRCQQRIAAADTAGISAWLTEQLEGQAAKTPSFTGQVLQHLRIKLNPTLTGKLPLDVAMWRFQTALRDFGRLIAADRESAAGELMKRPVKNRPILEGGDLDRFRSAGDFGHGAAAAQLAAARDAVYCAAVSGANTRSATAGHLWILQVPTGAGKTLAALGWAVERRRLRRVAGHFGGKIFYALPFTSIIDQTATVIRRLWPEADHASGLAIHHHLADYGVDEEAKYEGARKRAWAEAWRADVVCTTFVQIAHALFHGTAADARRFSELAQNGLLILDEAQALPAELWPTLRIALRSLATNFGVDVLLLTATTPALFHEEDAPADLSPERATVDLEGAFDRYAVYIEAGPAWSAADVVEAAALSLAPDAANYSGLILLNTINEALAVYDFVQKHPAFRNRLLLHLSTNLRPKDRANILRELKTREQADQPRLLVATQVVEAGVDLTFDVVFRAEAPLDAIVQAAGRCNRHGTSRRGEVHVFPLRGASANRIYGNIKMAAAAELLHELTSAFSGQPISEPEFAAKVPEFFRRIAGRMGEAQNKFRAVLEAITAFEFAALRGDWKDDPTRKLKHVELISDDGAKVPVFIETDDEDAAIWSELVAVHQELDLRRRRARLREMRSKVGARIVEVPQHLNAPPLSPIVGLARVAQSESERFYDLRTGWRRSLPNQL
jgi:CRISPR-associated endonuclease/helicase Cas3